MKHKKNKKTKKVQKRFSVFLFAIAGIIVVCAAAGIFLSFQKEPASIYISPENPKQGDTVFISVKTNAQKVAGNFEQKNLVFYKKANSNEWIAFLGIDADQEPGNYTIYADTALAEHLTKDVKVGLAGFSSQVAVAAPSPQKTGITNQKAVDNIVKNDNPALKKILDNFTAKPYFTLPFLDPLSSMKISGFSFGKFISFAKYKLQHFGVDLQAPEKTNIYSVNDGKVVATLDLSNYGKTIIIDHGLDIFSLYLHLEEFKVAEGQMVKRGQLIGLSGETGYATAPHLHFSMRVGSSRIDPIAFIETTQKIKDNSMLANIAAAFLNFFK